MFLKINPGQILDNLRIHFNDDQMWGVNLILALIMFGVALGITVDDFKRLFQNPKIFMTGILAQFVLFPFLAYLLVNLLNPYPSIALGMIMVAACPGGNISNFSTQLAGGNAALSVSLTAFATLASIIMTPLNLAFWGSLYQPTAQILREVELDPLKLVEIVSLILGIPLLLGMLIRYRIPMLAQRMSKFLRPLSVGILLLFIAVAFYENRYIFVDFVHHVVLVVLALNFLGYFAGFQFSRLMGLNYRDQKTISIETGIQNSGLGLLLCFAFFDGLGGMALCLAFWSVWDIASGLLLAYYWSKRTVKSTVV
ncbi:MAG: bile acid:sodium symporter family protein [Flavobacteriaceae bacterium]|nr:bile acid:sodium symporter family protein [Flavobacteriaceae bacterium]